jgi:hypothetical protein
MKVVRLSVLCTGRLNPPSKYPCYSFLLEAETTKWPHSAAGNINSNETVEDRTRELPACSAMPQPTAPPRTPSFSVLLFKVFLKSKAGFFMLRHYAPPKCKSISCYNSHVCEIVCMGQKQVNYWCLETKASENI